MGRLIAMIVAALTGWAWALHRFRLIHRVDCWTRQGVSTGIEGRIRRTPLQPWDRSRVTYRWTCECLSTLLGDVTNPWDGPLGRATVAAMRGESFSTTRLFADVEDCTTLTIATTTSPLRWAPYPMVELYFDDQPGRRKVILDPREVAILLVELSARWRECCL